MKEVFLIGEKNQAKWARIRESIDHGNLVCLPSDTVYGIACDPLSPAALAKLFAVKGRSGEKPVALVLSNVDRVHDLLPDLDPQILAAVDVLLPGPVTVIVPAARDNAHQLSTNLGSPGSIGIRVMPSPLDNIYRKLPSPLALTSANLSGYTATPLFNEVSWEVLDACEYAIDAGPCPVGIPSTVIDLRPLASGGQACILREGALSRREAEGLLT